MIRRLFSLVLFAVIGVSHANAQSFPATQTTPQAEVFRYVSGLVSQGYPLEQTVAPTATEACQRGAQATGWTFHFLGSPNWCKYTKPGESVYTDAAHAITYRCGQSYQPTNICPPVYTCPTDYRLEGTMCVPDLCPLGYDRDASGQCVKDCTAKRGMSLPNTHYRVGESGNGALGGCKFNCATRVKFAIAVYGDPDSEPQSEWISTSCTYTGQAADNGDFNAEGTGTNVPPPDKPTKPDDCMSQGMGYIQSSSGQTSCVPSSSAPPAQRPDEVRHDGSKESGKPGSDGAPDPNAPDYKQERESATSKGGDIIINKEERIKQPGYDQGTPQPCPEGYVSDGQGYCVKSSAQRQKEADYCRENPNTPICKTINQGAPNKDTPGDSGGTCKADDTSAACAKLDAAPDGDAIPETSIGLNSISTVAVGSNASCPQGPQLPKGLGQFPMDGICMYATGLRPIILALAWLSAGLIVLGAFRE